MSYDCGKVFDLILLELSQVLFSYLVVFFKRPLSYQWILFNTNNATIRFTSSDRRGPRTCPRGYERIGSDRSGYGCYSFSRKRMGWIEAKKQCDLNGAHLLRLETQEEADNIVSHLQSQSRRRYSPFLYICLILQEFLTLSWFEAKYRPAFLSTTPLQSMSGFVSAFS